MHQRMHSGCQSSLFFQNLCFPVFSRLVVDLHIGIQPAFCSYFVSGIFHPLCDGHIITLIDIPGTGTSLDGFDCSRTVQRDLSTFFAGRKCSSFFKRTNPSAAAFRARARLSISRCVTSLDVVPLNVLTFAFICYYLPIPVTFQSHFRIAVFVSPKFFLFLMSCGSSLP